jgi:DNA-binding beta-propeller fold protein YncE
MPTTLLCDPDADKVYCLNDGDGSISVIDAAHDSVVAVFEPGRWTGSAALAGQGRLLVSLDDIGTPIRTTPTSEHGLVVVDMARCTVVRVIDSTVTPARLVRDEQRRLSYGLCTSEPGSSGGSSVVVVDCRTDRLLQRLNVGGTPHSVVVDPISGRAFVLFADRPHIAVLPKPSR